jgi:hypothetical protein
VTQVERQPGQQVGGTDRREVHADRTDGEARIGTAHHVHGDGVGIGGERFATERAGIQGHGRCNVRSVFGADRGSARRITPNPAGAVRPLPSGGPTSAADGADRMTAVAEHEASHAPPKASCQVLRNGWLRALRRTFAPSSSSRDVDTPVAARIV